MTPLGLAERQALFMKTRRHHNNKGYQQIKNGTPAKQMRRLANQLGVPYSKPSGGTMEKINVEEIWKKHYMGHQDERDNIASRRAAIKEIVELVVDKCYEESTVEYYLEGDYEGDGYDCVHNVDKESILKVKQLIDYDTRRIQE